MKTKATASIRALESNRVPIPVQGGFALLAALFLVSCSSDSSNGPVSKKDGGRDQAGSGKLDTGTSDTTGAGPDTARADGAGASEAMPAGCSYGGQTYPPGASVPGPCGTCICLATGTVSCPPCPDGGATPDTRPADVPMVTCTQGGITYNPGQGVPRADGCPGSCVCLNNGQIGSCTGGCQDGGPVTPLDTAKRDQAPGPDTRDGRADAPDAPIVVPPDAPMDLPREPGAERPADLPPIDTACAAGLPCTVTGGGQGLCQNGACVACSGAQADNRCATVYGAGNVCVSGRCVAGCNNSSQCTGGQICNTTTHVCAACNAYTMDAGDPEAASDQRCRADTAYGQGTICLAGACTRGDCHDSTDCNAGRLCGSSVANACGDCTAGAAGDTQCRNDTRYGSSYICLNNLCVQGTCHATSECTGTVGTLGQVCGATTHTCGACTSDAQCRAEFGTGTGSRPICVTTTGLTNTGLCVPNPTTGTTGRLCPTSNVVCPVNSADFCCGGTARACVAGNCCVDDDCVGQGVDSLCQNNVCSRCEAATGNSFMVDPVNGNDTIATGSALAGGAAAPECAFKTLTKALDFITQSGDVVPTAGTSLTIIGSGSVAAPTPLTGEELPITVPRNVTITTQGSPIRLSLADTQQGFSFTRSPAALSPTTAAPITVARSGGAPAYGIRVAVAGTGNTGGVTISNVTVNNCGAGGGAIEVASGTVGMSNLAVSNAAADGIRITGGTVTMAATAVDGAGADGINVVAGTTAGTVTINAGVQVTNSTGNGLTVAGGTTTITNDSTTNPTQFNTNGGNGIAVSGTAVLNLTGAISGTNRSVVTQGNTGDNVSYASTGDSTINRLYSFDSDGDGLEIRAGSSITVRNSSFLGNGANGIHIAASPTSATDDVSNIDLGSTVTPAGSANRGRNTLQTASATPTDFRNLGAGLCIDAFDPAAPASQTLAAQANLFAGETTGTYDCGTDATPDHELTVAATCTGRVDIGIPAGSPVTIAPAYCVLP